MIHSTIGLAVCLACQASQANPKPAAETQSVAELAPRLRLAAGRLDSGFASPLFEDLCERRGDVSAVGLSKDQLGLILEMDASARTILRHWLCRPRPKGSPPLQVEDLDRAKAFVIGHMEAILLECVLTPRQAAEHRKLASKPIMPPREGRYTLIPEGEEDPPPMDMGIGFAVIHNLILDQDSSKRDGCGCSDTFRLILGVDRMRKWGALPDLAGEQKALHKRLNAIACDAQKQWLQRSIAWYDADHRMPPEQWSLPPTPAMTSRLSESGQRLRASVVSHAEEILLDAVLDPSQRTELKRRLWIDRGVRALLDPELSAILRLAKWQREAIRVKLEERTAFWTWASTHHASDESMEFFRRINARGHITTPEEDVLKRRFWKANERNYEELLANFDAPIWDILSTAQSRTLAKILRKPIPKKEDEKTKKKSSRAG